jgi:uncharacterized small protein (DUF1192 family)
MDSDLLAQVAMSVGSVVVSVAVLTERIRNLAREVERVETDARRESERQDKALSAAFKRIDELKEKNQ